MADKKTLLIVGAGPKALAIAAKCAAAKAHGWTVPELIVIDEVGIGANWSGRAGYTDGKQQLGTPADKDVGFPYASDCWWSSSPSIDEWMLRFSWQHYLASLRGPGVLGFGEWVDRGRPQPSHLEWARYLNWVAGRLALQEEGASVSEIHSSGQRWRLGLTSSKGERTVEGDGLVLTGPGPPIAVCETQPTGHRRVLDGRNFWLQMDRFRELPGRVTVCVIGSGETAAAIAVGLLRVLPEDSWIDIVSPHGFVYSRGESYEENHPFSDPTGWPGLAKEHREEFVRRTDRAVFSLQAKAVLNTARNVDTRAGYVVAFRTLEHGEESQVELMLKYGTREEPVQYDYVICATSFNQLWFLEAMTTDAKASLEQAVGQELRPREDAKSAVAAIESAIERDLSVRELQPRLHLPMLSGFAQGPGFPNLSSLGLLSDRILRGYCDPPTS